jgi:hypothetical protein
MKLVRINNKLGTCDILHTKFEAATRTEKTVTLTDKEWEQLQKVSHFYTNAVISLETDLSDDTKKSVPAPVKDDAMPTAHAINPRVFAEEVKQPSAETPPPFTTIEQHPAPYIERPVKAAFQEEAALEAPLPSDAVAPAQNDNQNNNFSRGKRNRRG